MFQNYCTCRQRALNSSRSRWRMVSLLSSKRSFHSANWRGHGRESKLVVSCEGHVSMRFSYLQGTNMVLVGLFLTWREI